MAASCWGVTPSLLLNRAAVISFCSRWGAERSQGQYPDLPFSITISAPLEGRML